MVQLRSINKRRSSHGQRGVVFIWFALFLPVLLGLVGLAIDLGRLNLINVELQNAADAAALAASRAYATGEDAQKEAETVANKNYADGDLVPTSAVKASVATGFAYSNAVQVDIALTGVNLIFGPFLGMSTTNVQATAVAAQSPITSSHYILVQ